MLYRSFTTFFFRHGLIFAPRAAKSYNNFLRAVFSKLKPWLNPSVRLALRVYCILFVKQ